MEDFLEAMRKVGAAIEALDKALEALSQAKETLKKIGNLAEESCEEEISNND